MHSCGRAREVSRAEFAAEFDAQVEVLPPTTCLLGFSARRRAWLVHGFAADAPHGRERLDPLTRFLDRFVRPRLGVASFWFFLNHWDGWREGAPYGERYRWVAATEGIGHVHDWKLGAGEIPILSPTRWWVACYGAHRGDPSAVLLPEPHYLARGCYRPLRARLWLERRPWRTRAQGAVFAGGDHGYDRAGVVRSRRRARELAESGELPLVVHIGRGMSRRAQLAYRYLLDLDGSVRTWDGWAWKLLSGSTVLSPESIWTTFFTELFEPWRHYVPLAPDLSDLAARLAWCKEHDDECRRIAMRARRRALEVYEPRWVGERLATRLRERLAPERSPVAVGG
jgi:hypothetical protein